MSDSAGSSSLGGIIAGVVIAFLVIVGIVVAVVIFLYRRKKNQDYITNIHLESPGSPYSSLARNETGSVGISMPPDSNRSTRTLKNDWEIALRDLEFQEEIGEGAFGLVYRGTWRAQNVAIKKLMKGPKDLTEQQLNEFHEEITLMKYCFVIVVSDPLSGI